MGRNLIEWETTKITFKALAEKHDVKEGTLKSRRSREKWTRNKDATIKKACYIAEYLNRLILTSILAQMLR